MRRSLDLVQALGDVASTADLTTALIARFVTSRRGRENPNTTRTHLRKLSACCAIAVGNGWLAISPFAIRRSWVRAVTPATPRVHSRQELARVLQLAEREVRQAHPAHRWPDASAQLAPPPPWRPVPPEHRPRTSQVPLRRDGRTFRTTLEALMWAVFGVS